jgi:hypothetical protein
MQILAGNFGSGSSVFINVIEPRERQQIDDRRLI